MQFIPENLLLPAGILVLLAAVFIVVQMTAALRVGTTTAVNRLRRWRRLPEAMVRLSAAPSLEAAVQGITAALAEGLGARGALALVRGGGKEGPARGKLHVAAAEGTLRGQRDQEMVRAALEVPELARFGKGVEGDEILQLPARKLPTTFRDTFQEVGRGGLVALRSELSRAAGGTAATSLIILHVTGWRRLDRMDLEALEGALRQFPRVVEATTSRFAQAEVLEQLLEEARVKDGLIRMLLGSFQHDLGNTLASLQAGLARAWEASEAQAAPGDGGDAQFAELYRTIQLAANVARSGEGMVDIADGRSPVVMVEPHSPAEVFEQVIRPFLTLRARRRPELEIEVDIPDGLASIYIDRVAFFRALSNVLHNAFKYTREGAIRVRAYKEGDQVTFAVSDTGPGIPTEDLSSIGQYRFRARATAGTGGEGIGLWVTRRLLEAMGGDLHVESKTPEAAGSGSGSTFYLSFAASPERLDPTVVQIDGLPRRSAGSE